MVEQFQLNWQVVACSDYCYGVNTQHTLLTVISFSTCTFRHYWLVVAKNKLQLFALFSTLFVVEQQLNMQLQKGGFSTTDKLLATGFIKPVEEATWLLLIVVVLKKNEKLKICVIDFMKFNATTKKNLYLFPFKDDVINIVTKYEVYTFLDEFQDIIKFQLHQKININSRL